jgi:uroporphyrinogen-III synthase
LPDEVVFFSSPQSARMFGSFRIPSSNQVGVIGAGTSVHLPKEVIPDFIGRGQTKEVAQQFKEWLGERKVVFFVGDNSHRTIQRALNPQQFREVIVYKTHPVQAKLPSCAVFTFTSPSNTDAIDVDLVGKGHAVALGTSCAEALRKKGINPIISKDYSNFALWNAIFSALHS